MTIFNQRFPSSPLLIDRKTMAEERLEHLINFEKIISPETPLEHLLISTPEFQVGYHWGLPRFGHPEGKVGYHVKEVLDNVNLLPVDLNTRRQLRLITLVHDTFKYKENKGLAGNGFRHHGLLAREFIQPIVSDTTILDIVELHDEAFYIWRAATLEKRAEAAAHRLENLMNRIGKNLQLYFLFFKCDTQTGDKMQAPLYWFENIIKEAGV